VKIHNPNNLPLIDYRTVKPLQGKLKDLSQKNHDRLLNVLNHRGFKSPLQLWDKGDGNYYIMDGHQRQRVMLKNDLNDDGSYEVPYLLVEADNELDAKAQLLEITSQYGTITQEGFDEFTAEMPEAELVNINFDALYHPQETEAPETEEDEPPAVEEGEPPVSQPGEIYQLGNHRLMCGSATLLEDVEKLANGTACDLFLTDPPYNVDYTGKTKDALKIDNDKQGNDQFRQFLVDGFTNAVAVLKKGASFYIFHADSEGYNFRGACYDAGLQIRQCLSWIKNSMVMGRQDYQWKHEPILYGWKDGASHSWYSDRKQTTVLNFDRPTQSKEHPTMKPISILAYLMANSSKQGDIILDLFGGSGSTLIAAEQLERTCYMMELDPKYCDVIRKRYANFKGEGERWVESTPALGAD
jgi:DNA modification methylase